MLVKSDSTNHCNWEYVDSKSEVEGIYDSDINRNIQAYPFSFNIFPCPNEEMNANGQYDMKVDITAVEFLAKNHFDFNKCIYDGLWYSKYE